MPDPRVGNNLDIQSIASKVGSMWSLISIRLYPVARNRGYHYDNYCNDTALALLFNESVDLMGVLDHFGLR